MPEQMFTECPLTDKQLALRVQNCTKLPSPPRIAMQIIELGRDPEADLHRLAHLIELDPALATKILRVANSPLYARVRKVETLTGALGVLGLNATLTLALSFTLVSSMYSSGYGGIDYSLFWRRSVLAAIFARALGRRAGHMDAEGLFLAGLVQDIGMLVLDRAVPEIYASVGASQADHEALVLAEQQHLGADHGAVGAWLLGQWRFPVKLQRAVAASHGVRDTGTQDDDWLFVRCVALSGRLADIWLADQPARAIRHAARVAEGMLQIDHDALNDLLAQGAAQFGEMEGLFQVGLVDAKLAESTLDQAHEVLLARNLRLLQNATRN